MQKIKNMVQALDYLRKELSKGATLAKLAMSRTDFALGTYFAGIPENFDQNQLNFQWGIRGLSGEPMVFAKMIKSFIHDPGCVVLVEDIDPFASPFPAEEDASYRTRAMTYRDEVYWNLSGMHLSENDILELVNQPNPYPSSAFFSTARVSEQLDDSGLQRVVDHLTGVAVWAFDGDSFLIWWREDLRPFPLQFSPESAG
jgi:hypothetical protein